MNSITTINQLTQILDNTSADQHAKVMKKIKLNVAELEGYATWRDGCYTRNCLARTEKYELILLCWDVDAKTPIHNHGGKDCWVYQVQGTVQEIRYKQVNILLKESNRMTLSPEKLTYMNDSMGCHRIENVSDQRAMTLHIYVSPIDACEVYNDQKGCFELKKMSYDTHKKDLVDTIVL